MNSFVLRLALIISTIILCIGCTSDSLTVEEVKYDKFQNEYDLKPEIVDWMDIWNCYGLRIYDSVLVSVDWKRPDGFIRVYNLRTKTQIGAFGKIGKGPGEYFRAPRLTPVYFFENGELIVQFDNGERLIQNINLSQSIKQNRIVEHSSYKLPEDTWVSSPFLYDSKVFSADSSVLRVYNTITNETIMTHEPIKTEQDLVGMPARLVRIMYLEKAPNINRVIGSFNVQKRIHVYNLEGELLRVIKEKGDHFFDTSDRSFYLKNKTHFSNSFLSDEYILVLNENRIERNKGGELLLFDYDGNALIKYKLDRYLNIGAVDWNEKKFYSNSYEDGTVISYSLKGIE